MAGFFKDPEFQSHLIAFMCRDRNFLKRTSGLLEVDDFKPRKGESQANQILAEMALTFWREYGEPIGGMLRTEVLDKCREERYGSKLKEQLLDTVEEIRGNHSLVAVEALEQKVIEYKARRFKQQAIQELIDLQERGKLTDDRFMRILADSQQVFGRGYKITNYMTGLEQRIRRRQIESQRRFPYFMIDPLDDLIRMIPRGSMALFLAKFNVGKSLALVYMAYAMALQGYNVLFITLEDPEEEVMDRLDGLLTGLPVRKLVDQEDKLRKRFKKASAKLKGRIKVIDGTEGSFTVQKIQDVWEKERNRGFIGDCVIVDYDDEIVPAVRHKGESARRMEFADIYRDLRKFAATCNIYLWTAAQARRGKDSQMIVRGEDTAEDISKIRKVALAIGIGSGPKEWEDGSGISNSRHLFVARHRFDRSKLGCTIMGDFERGIFYEAEATMEKKAMLAKKKKQEAKAKAAT